jgi:3D (Asp-Asp-Asp) domain-containing protein
MSGYIIMIFMLFLLGMDPMALQDTRFIGNVAEPVKEVLQASEYNIVAAHRVTVTAYSSTPEETDDTPFTTASNTQVRHGIVATNMLPFGTYVMIPEYFGDEVFVVEDRMHRRKVDFVDVWMSTKNKALKFGIHETIILVVEEPQGIAMK